MLACSLALIFAWTFALVPAAPVLVLVAVGDGVAAVVALLAFPALFELSFVVQPATKTPKANKVERARVFRKVFLLYPVRVYFF